MQNLKKKVRMILKRYLYCIISDTVCIIWSHFFWEAVHIYLTLVVIYLIRRKCAFKDVISNKHTDLLIIGPSCTLKWTNPVLFRISEPYLVSCKFFFSFDPIFLHLKLVKKGVIFVWCGQFVKNFPFSPEIIFFYGSGLLPWES